MAAAAYESKSDVSGLATNFEDLDRMLGGLHASDLIILAGRPSMGKTALATNIAFNVARNRLNAMRGGDFENEPNKGGVVAFFSLEMSAEQLATRLLSDAAEIESDRIRVQAERREERARAATEDEIKASVNRAKREAQAAAEETAPEWLRSESAASKAGYRTF